MARQCSICAHPMAARINKALLDGDAVNRVATDFEVKRPALQRHYHNHLIAKLPPDKDPRKSTKPRQQQVITHQAAKAALADIDKFEPRVYYLRQLRRVERIAEQGELEQVPGVTLNAVESSRRLMSDAIGLFVDHNANDGANDAQALLEQINQVATEPEERSVLARLLLKLGHEEPQFPGHDPGPDQEVVYVDVELEEDDEVAA